jgi:hypothetical protein
MRRLGRIIVIACASTVAASPVWASDLCINSTVFASPLVAKNLTVPGKNRCKPLHGFTPFGMAVGTACRTPDGELLRIHFTIHLSDSDATALAACNFNVPELTGNCRLKAIFESNTIQSFADASAVASKCIGESVP